MKKSISIIIAAVSFMALSCSKTDTDSLGLKQSVEKGVSDINYALKTISGTQDYQILIANSTPVNSEEKGSYADSITLDMVAGIYDFQPDFFHFHNFFIPYPLFKKTGTSDQMIVNLPQKLIFHPGHLHKVNPPDTLLNNDFTIKASDYHYFYSWLNNFDYKLTADFTLDNNDLGSLEVISASEGATGSSYYSKYTFTEGYNINVSFQSGDTTISSFTLLKDDDVLMKETVVFTGTDFHRRERQYILTIGNVDIKRGSGIDSIQVYLDGVLQQKAGARIVDSTDSDGSIRHHRDILLTFDDGTTTNLSDLLDPVHEVLKSIVDSLHSMNFAKNIVDYIAIGINYCMHYH